MSMVPFQPGGARPMPRQLFGVYRGVITAVSWPKVFFRLPRKFGDTVLPPAEMLEWPGHPSEPRVTGSAGTGPHTHTIGLQDLAVGDRIVVAFIDGDYNSPLVLGKVRP